MYVTKNILYFYWILLFMSWSLTFCFIFMRKKKVAISIKDPKDKASEKENKGT